MKINEGKSHLRGQRSGQKNVVVVVKKCYSGIALVFLTLFFPSFMSLL